MFSSLYSALSGMVGFSKALDVISNNVANMNTPGFKGGELRFLDLFYRYGVEQGGGQGGQQIGQGVDTGSTRTNFNQGELRATSSTLDVAIEGNGFFVLQKNGEYFYTRNGQFEFNDEGILVDRASQATVLASNGGALGQISIAGLRVNAPNATTEIKFIEGLNSGSTSHEITDVEVYDSTGTKHTLIVRFTRDNEVALNTSSPLLMTTDTVNTLSLIVSALSTAHTRSLDATALTVNTLDASALSTNHIRSLNPAVLTTGALDLSMLSTEHVRSLNAAELTTVTTAVADYVVQPGDTWAIIATNIYGDANAAEALQSELANPPLNDFETLINIPSSLSFYEIQSGDDWESIAELLYDDGDGATVLETALGNPDLNVITTLFDFPATLSVPAVTPFYTVPAGGDNWESIASELYGRSSAAEALRNALGNPAITVGTELTGMPASLTYYEIQFGDNWESIAELLYDDGDGDSVLEIALSSPTLTPGTGLINLPATLTVPAATPFYTVPVGGTWVSIANALYGDPLAAEALQDALGNPALNDGDELTGMPSTLSYYEIQSGDNWALIATRLYADVDGADELETALGSPTLTPGATLFDLPATLSVAAAVPFYTVQAGDDWGDIALAVYGQAGAASDVATALGLDPLVNPTVGTDLTGFPDPLNLAAPLTIPAAAPYYVIQAGDTWDGIATTLYGSPFGAELQAAFPVGTALTAGQRLTQPPLPTTLTLSAGTRWVVDVLEGTTTIGTGEVRYSGSTMPITAFQTMTINYAPVGALANTITLDFSSTSSGSSASSTLKVGSQNGYTSGSLIESTFDENGVLTLKYSNSQTVKHDQLALAWFQNLQDLTLTGGSLYSAKSGQMPFTGTAKMNGMGGIFAKHVEMSNVDLTSQFADIVIVQRGYQASSQVISVVNEMTQQLLDMRGRR